MIQVTGRISADSLVPIWSQDRGTKRGWTELFAIPKVRCEDVGSWGLSFTPWKINMEPENDGLEDYFPFQLGDC